MMIVLAMIDMRVWFTMAYPVYGVGLLLLVAVEAVGRRVAWAPSAGWPSAAAASSRPRS